jgi:hypothetical protein
MNSFPDTQQLRPSSAASTTKALPPMPRHEGVRSYGISVPDKRPQANADRPEGRRLVDVVHVRPAQTRPRPAASDGGPALPSSPATAIHLPVAGGPQGDAAARFLDDDLDLQRLARISRRFNELMPSAPGIRGDGPERTEHDTRLAGHAGSDLLARAMACALEDIAALACPRRSVRSCTATQSREAGEVGLEVLEAAMRGVMAVPVQARVVLIERIPRLFTALRPGDRLEALYAVVRSLGADELGLVLGPLIVMARVGPTAGGIPWAQSGTALALLRGEIAV